MRTARNVTVMPRRQDNAPTFGTPAPESAPARNPRIYLLWAGVGLFLAAVVALVLYPFLSYQVVVQKAAFTHDYPKAPDRVPLGQLFSEENIAELENGKGLEIRLVSNYYGRREGEEVFLIDPWKKYEETKVPERREYIAAKRKELDEMLKRWQVPKPRDWRVELLLDDTEGVDGRLRSFAAGKLDSLDYGDKVASGDGVDLSVYRLSLTDQLELKTQARVKQGEGPAGFDRLKQAIVQLEDQPDKPQSSVATGLFNALAENSGRPNRHVVVVSDGMENSPLTASFYETPPAFDGSNWKELREGLSKFKPMPNLAGVRVDWYTPPEPRQHVAIKIRAAHKFWEAWLKEAGAEVRMHF